MYKIVPAIKDTYITNKIINGNRKYNSNTGIAGTLDLYKLYGATFSNNVPNLELTRAFIKFDLDDLINKHNNNQIDVTHNSFWAKIYLTDVYGGQPTPDDFTLTVSPLSKSFDEGKGKDVVY